MKADRTPKLPPTAYFETSIVSGFARKQMSEQEQAATVRLFELWHEERVSLVTSSVTNDELDLVPPEHRPEHEAVYACLRKIPTVDEQTVWPRAVKAGSQVYPPAVVNDPDFGPLQELLRDRPDALHIFQALKNGVDYLVTRDEATILVHAAELEAHFGVRVVLPSALVAVLDRAAN